jgi:hypothetical protein
MAPLVATCVWDVTPELVIALDDLFGESTDAYVNGSQVWLRDDGPRGVTLEWRLHPVAGYRLPPGVDTYSVFSSVALALATGAPPPAPPESLWDGLEAFAAYGDELEPAPLGQAAAESIGITPRVVGLVDHSAVGDAWERSRGRLSVVALLLEQLETR